MNLLLDMNIPIVWEDFLNEAGHKTLHWSNVGDGRAPDTEIMAWAKANGFVVFTHDLDFGTLLYATNARSPSVIQLRTEHILPEYAGNTILQTLASIEEELHSGALVTIDPHKKRIRLLPLGIRH